MRWLLALFVTLPGAALAEVCAEARPDWNGVPVSALGETVTLLFSPMGLFLLISTLAALRFRSQWGGVVVTVGWTAFATLLTMADPTGVRALAQAEGCIGSSTLFIAIAAAISVATIIYTAPRKAASTGE
ncbi:MAG: hypothetical protein AAGM84_13400 [Pseudomonadota bacterium]